MLTRDSTLETVKDAADNLYHLLDLMYANISDISPEKVNSLTGLCFDMSSRISIWLDAEFERREQTN